MQYNGLGDAYRHALWNALATVKLGEILTEQLTSAHENRAPDYPFEYKEVEMDLFNNQIGSEIGSESSFMLIGKVKFAIENGDLRYLSNTNPRATENSILTPTNQ